MLIDIHASCPYESKASERAKRVESLVKGSKERQFVVLTDWWTDH